MGSEGVYCRLEVNINLSTRKLRVEQAALLVMTDEANVSSHGKNASFLWWNTQLQPSFLQSAVRK